MNDIASAARMHDWINEVAGPSSDVHDMLDEALAEAHQRGRLTASVIADAGHVLLDGFCPICNGSCLVGFGNPA